MPQSVFGIILSGGRSLRLFPFNKVLSDLTGSGRTLIQDAVDRLAGPAGSGRGVPLVRPKNVLVVASPETAPHMARQLRFPKERFLADPARRGTWPAILWALAQLRSGALREDQNADPVVAVVTADHVIPDVRAFRRSVSQAIELAQKEPAIVLVGVKPSKEPADWLGFGAQRERGNVVVGFEEKPSVGRANAMIRARGWTWNSGMFFMRLSTAEAALRFCQPSMAKIYERIIEDLTHGRRKDAARRFSEFPAKIPHPADPARLADNSIDYAIVAPLSAAARSGFKLLCASQPLIRWTDLGQWNALRKVVKAVRWNNIVVGSVKTGQKTENCILVADKNHRLNIGKLDGMIAAFSNRTLLLLPETHVGEVKALVEAFQSAGAPSVYERHCERCDFEVKGGKVVAFGLKGVQVKLQGRYAAVDSKP